MAHVQQCLVSSSFSSTKKWSLLKLVHSINRMALPRCQKSESVRIMTGYDWCRFFSTLSEVRCEICMRRTEIVTLLEARFVFYS